MVRPVERTSCLAEGTSVSHTVIQEKKAAVSEDKSWVEKRKGTLAYKFGAWIFQHTTVATLATLALHSSSSNSDDAQLHPAPVTYASQTQVAMKMNPWPSRTSCMAHANMLRSTRASKSNYKGSGRYQVANNAVTHSHGIVILVLPYLIVFHPIFI